MPIDPAIIDEMLPYMTTKYGNPSSLHSFGREAQAALHVAQRNVGKLVGAAEPQNEIYFTSSATESNNLALRGVSLRNKEKGNHIIISPIEHSSITNAAKYLQLRDYEVTILPIGEDGILDANSLTNAITPRTILVSVTQANNEIGTIQPIDKLSSATRDAGVLLHVDATASVGKIPIDVVSSGIDLLTISSNDISGPKGVGAIFIKDGTPIEPIMVGGGQQRGLRSGTEDIAAIVGMGMAAEIAHGRLEPDGERMKRMRDRIIESILEDVEMTSLYGDRERRLPSNVMMGVFGVEGTQLINELDKQGITASTGSACTAKDLAVSHALQAIGIRDTERYGSILFSLSRWNSESDVDRLLSALPPIVSDLRDISPIWKFRDRLKEFYS